MIRRRRMLEYRGEGERVNNRIYRVRRIEIIGGEEYMRRNGYTKMEIETKQMIYGDIGGSGKKVVISEMIRRRRMLEYRGEGERVNNRIYRVRVLESRENTGINMIITKKGRVERWRESIEKVGGLRVVEIGKENMEEMMGGGIMGYDIIIVLYGMIKEIVQLTSVPNAF